MSDAALVTPARARVGPAGVAVALLVVPLLYLPALDAPFAQPKLAVLLLAGALGLGGALLAWARGAASWPRRPSLLAVAAVAVAATTLVSAALAAWRRPEGAPYASAELARLAAMFGVALAAAQAAPDADWRRRVTDAITVSAGIVSALGLLQHVRLLPLALPVISIPGSTFGNRNIAAEAVALSIPFGLAALGGSGRRDGRNARAVMLALLLIELVYVAATRARGAWIGAAAGVGVFLLVRRPSPGPKVAVALLPIAALLLFAVVFPGRWMPRDSLDAKRFAPAAHVVRDAVDLQSPVIRTRAGLWRRTVAMWREHPIAGLGPGNFAVLFPLHAEPGAAADGVMSATMVPRRPHNDLLERLVETGVIGALAFVALFAAALRAGWRWRRATGDGGVDTAAAAAGTVAAVLGCGLTGFPLAMPATALLTATALGLLAGLKPPGISVEAEAPAAGASRGPLALIAAALAAVALAGGAAALSTRALAASYALGRAEAALSRPDGVADALPYYARAERWATTAERFPIALRRAQAALRASEFELRTGRGAEALGAAERALAIEPHSPHAWAERAAAQLAKSPRNFDGAVSDAQHALRLFKDHPGARRTLALVEVFREGTREAYRRQYERSDADDHGAP
jgi:O-antigen ligase